MTSVTVELRCDDTNHLYWRKQGTPTWSLLTLRPDDAPDITEVSSSAVTFGFVQHSGSTHDVVYTTDPGSTSQSLPASIQVTSGAGNDVYFSRSGSSPRWYCGHVKVSSS